jgi:hypothetical protein
MATHLPAEGMVESNTAAFAVTSPKVIISADCLAIRARHFSDDPFRMTIIFIFNVVIEVSVSFHCRIAKVVNTVE